MRFVKGYTAICAGYLAAAAAVIGLLAGLIGWEKSVVKLLAVVVFLMFAAIGVRVIGAAAMKKYQTFVSKLNDECDAESFIKLTDTSYNRACRVKKIRFPGDVIGLIMRLDRAVALMWQGDFDGAIDIAKEVIRAFQCSDADKRFKFRTVLAGAYDDLAQIYCMRNADGDIEKARECVDAISKLGDVSLQSKVVYTTHRINVAEGKELDSAWAYFSDLLEKTKMKRAQLLLHGLLAEIYEKQDIPEKAAEEYEILAREIPGQRLGRIIV